MPPTPTPTAPAALATRDAVVHRLADRGGLWPLVPWNPCALCALPRRVPTPAPLCGGCRELRALYGTALADVHPAALTARDWALGGALRTFKDTDHADPGSPRALVFAAVLSAFLQDVIPATNAPLVTAVPSSSPVVPAALTRARREGWPAPDLQVVVAARAGFPRQRRRPHPERRRIEGKWLIDATAVAGRDVLVLDDVATTGATLHSLAAALADAGAASVRAAVLARIVGPDAHWLLDLVQARHAVGIRWRPGSPRPGAPA